MRKKKPVAILIGLASMMLLAACQSQEKAPIETDEGTKKEGKSQIDAEQEVTTLNGVQMRASELLNKSELTMFYVWDPFCEDCKEEMKELDELSQEYAGKGIQVIGVIGNRGEKQESEIQTMVQGTGTSYTQLWELPEVQTMYAKESEELPFAFFTDSKGNVVGESYSGGKNSAQWKGIMEELHTSVCVEDHPAENSGGGG